MKNLNVAQTVQVLANIGVVVGIVFLVMEVRQNNELMDAQLKFNRLSFGDRLVYANRRKCRAICRLGEAGRRLHRWHARRH